MSVFAYYKGSTVTPIDYKKYEATLEMTEKMILDGLRAGYDLSTIAGFAKARLDKLEDQLCDYERKHPRQTRFVKIAHPSEWLQPAWGKHWEVCRAEWYVHIATLLRLKVIENDEMNGWLQIKDIE